MTDEQLDRMVRDADPYRPEVIGRLDGGGAEPPGGDHVRPTCDPAAAWSAAPPPHWSRPPPH